MRLAMQSKKKLGFIDGLIPIPENDSEKEEAWWEINTLVGQWILNTIKPTIQSSINYYEHTDELWIDLKECFLVDNELRKYKLKAALANCAQGGDSIKVYYSWLKKIMGRTRKLYTIAIICVEF